MTSIFLCVCPVTDHEFRHHIVKVAVDPRGDSWVNPQTTLTMLWRNSLSITNRRIKNWHRLFSYDNRLSNFPLSFADASHEFQIHVSVRILTRKFSQCLQLSWKKYFRSRAIGLNASRGRISPAKTGECPRIFPNFQNCARCEKDLKDNKHSSLYLGRKYARIFVLGHYLFLVTHSFPRATLSENCSLLGIDNVRGQISYLFLKRLSGPESSVNPQIWLAYHAHVIGPAFYDTALGKDFFPAA